MAGEMDILCDVLGRLALTCLVWLQSPWMKYSFDTDLKSQFFIRFLIKTKWQPFDETNQAALSREYNL